jgi:hypothetical protein
MPLDADDKPSRGVFDRFDHAVRRCRHNPKVPARLGHGLMVETVYVDGLPTRKAAQQTILAQ